MNIGIVVGSMREKSESGRVGEYLEEVLKNKNIISDTFNLKKISLPFWDEDFWEDTENWKQIWFPVSERLKNCSGFLFICPEYGGMASPVLKNFFLLCNRQELAHKPALIVSLSGSRGGAYPVSELRMSSYKNTFINYIPEHIVIRNVSHLLHNAVKDEFQKEDQFIRERIEYSINILIAYAEALASVRSKNLFDYKKFKNGM
ncbi:MAG: NAD(P)H-dependent oxidoreductase [Leptospiraceae bacterium]|nr:NAD(P)H-dependent oxidoreductase [Leptospiraceae bacterium]MCP5511082.1 NAD(P)H-dependent oxidoreductase [Leptospiraceae bacterium]